jgi:hypothetical protein
VVLRGHAIQRKCGDRQYDGRNKHDNECSRSATQDLLLFSPSGRWTNMRRSMVGSNRRDSFPRTSPSNVRARLTIQPLFPAQFARE